MSRLPRHVALATALLIATSAAAADDSPPAAPRQATIYAAASTSDAVRAITRRFSERTGVAVTTSLGSSSTLAHQIAQGAPADLFLTASTDWARFLGDRGEVAEQVELLSNRLVIITPPDNPAHVHAPADLKRSGVARVAMGDPQHVPAGQYGRQALERLGLWPEVRARVVAADDVREALAFVARGEVQAGIVYETDAAAQPGVQVVATLDPSLHTPIRYPLVLLKRAARNPAARELFGFLQSAEAAAEFQKRGFTVVRAEPASGAAPAAPSSPHEPEWLGLTAIERTAISLSLWVAGWAVAISLPPALALGYWLARRRFPGKAAVETLVNLALVLPPVVTGYLLLVVLGRRGWIGGWLDRGLGVHLAFTWKAAAIASAVVSFPLMVRAIRLAFQGVDARLEHAARTLGARPLDAFWTVSVPLARNGIIAGCVLAFARSLGEFGATIMFAGNIEGETRTIPVAIYTLINQPGGVERSWRLVAISVVIASLALVASEYLERRGAQRESA